MRKKKLIKSVVTSYFKQIAYVIIGLILPKAYLEYYGSEVNGLVNSITQFLGYITFLNMGLGSVISSSLYKPLAENNNEELSRVLKVSDKFFKNIAKILLLYTGILIVVYPLLINNGFDFGYVSLLIIVIVISMFSEYYFGTTWMYLLNADQKPYVVNIIQTVTVCINFIISIFLIRMQISIHVVKLVSSLIFIIKPILLSIYVKKNYNIDKNVKLSGNPIKQSKNGAAQHIAFTIFKSADVAVLTTFSTLKVVSVYSVYNFVVEAVLCLIQSVTDNMTAIFGDMISKGELKKITYYFEKYIVILHIAVTIIFCTANTMILCFIKLYTYNVKDMNYIEPFFATIMLLAYALYAIRIPYNQMVHAAGHYKETQNSAWIEAIINVVVSIIMVRNYGLVGVAMGTFLAMLYRMIYFVLYLSKNIIHFRISFFIKVMITDIISVSVIYFASRFISINANNFFEWGIRAMIVAFFYALITISVNFIINNRIILEMIKRSKRTE